VDPVVGSLFRTLDTRYGHLTIFANDIGAASQSLMRYGEWAENELSFLHALVGQGETVLDVGAYIGTHTLAFASFVGRQGQILAIEPQAHTFDVLRGNVEANGLENVHLVNAVASEAAGEVIIPSIDVGQRESFGSASLRDTLTSTQGDSPAAAVSPDSGDLVVRSITIDSLALDSLALIKIDAEGMEDRVLQGAVETIRRLSPIVYAECNSLEDGLKSFQLLKQFGYRVFAHIVDAFNPENFLGSRANIFEAARELALVGVPGNDISRIEGYQVRSCEMLLDITTADDLALALLNKPQYRPEVLRDCAAARSGGSAYLDQIDATHLEVERLSREVERLSREVERLSREVERFNREVERLGQDRERLSREVASQQAEGQRSQDTINTLHRSIEMERATTRHEVERIREALHSKVDASILQAGLIRKEADRLRVENAALRQESEEQQARAAKGADWWRPTALGRAISSQFQRKHGRRK